VVSFLQVPHQTPVHASPLPIRAAESSRGQPTRGGPPAWGLGEGLTTPRRENVSMLRNNQGQQ
jgi:hypothetical protein